MFIGIAKQMDGAGTEKDVAPNDPQATADIADGIAATWRPYELGAQAVACSNRRQHVQLVHATAIASDERFQRRADDVRVRAGNHDQHSARLMFHHVARARTT
jgi:hypothetical protein